MLCPHSQRFHGAGMKIDSISSDGIHKAEKDALEQIRKVFNQSAFSQSWHGYAGFELIDPRRPGDNHRLFGFPRQHSADESSAMSECASNLGLWNIASRHVRGHRMGRGSDSR